MFFIKTQIKNIINFEFGSLEIKDGILIQYYHENTTVDMKKVGAMQKGIKKLTKEQNIPLLLIGKRGVQPTIEVRKYGSTEKANKYISAMAILIIEGNIAHRLYGNMILTLDKRPMPSKLFVNKEKAIQWLSQYRK